MISTPRFRRFQGASLALFGLLAAALVGGQVQATRLPPSGSEGASHVAADLMRLAQRAGAAGVQPVENIQVGLPADKMLFDDQGRVGVRVTARDAAALEPALKALGMQVVACRPEYHLLEGFVSTGVLPQMNALGAQGLLGVMAISRPLTRVGSVTSQADFTHEADRVRGTNPAINGTGMRIGVISDSFNRLGGAAASVVAGDLPAGGVSILQEGPVGTSDEGRGMAELIHDLAPGADMVFGTAYDSEAKFAQMILDLADPTKGDCNIIVDDIIYLEEPFFQDGMVAQAVDSVVASGSAYFSAAGNQADLGYESQFRSAVDQRTGVTAHDFDPGPGVDTRQLVTVPAFGELHVSLQWDDPFYTQSGVDSDVDIQLYQPGSGALIAESANNNIGSQTPVERLVVRNFSFFSGSAEIVIRLKSGSAPARIKYVDFGETIQNEYNNTGSTAIGHAAAQGAMSVGAVDYDDQDNPSYFTAAGPTNILFSPTGVRLSSTDVRAKPDFAAIQGTNTTFFGQDSDGDGFPNFYGTSAAAPHAAAIAALVWQNNPGLTPVGVYNQLISTADSSINGPGWDKLTGNGLINAYDAVFGPAQPAPFPFNDGLENGVLTQVYETRTSGAGRIEVTTANGPATGNRHLVLTTAHDGRAGRSEVILHLNAAGLTGAVLSFREREYGDADQPMSASFVGSENTDGVALSVDGINWYRVASLTGAASTNSYQLQRYSLAAVAAANGLALGPDTRIKFQQFGNLKTPRGGIAIDDISIANLSGVSFGNTAYTVNENAGVATITALRAGDPNLALQVDFTTSNGTAIAPGDYLATSGTLLFQAGELTKTVQIPVVSDQLIEGPETVQLTLSNISGGVLLTPSTVTLTVVDDADIVSPSPLTATATGPSTVRLDWIDNSGNEDRFEIERKVGVGTFSLLSSVLPPLTSYLDVGLSTNVVYTYRVRAIQGGSTSSYSNQASVNISPIELEAGTYTVSEDAGQLIVRVTRVGDILSPATVQLKTMDGSATADSDYQAKTLSVDFVRGETTKEILIPITADRVLEPNETFDVILSNATGGSATLGEQKKATVTITNGGALPAPSNLKAVVAGSAQVQLTWTDNCINETAIDVERKAGQGAFSSLTSLAANTDAYTDNSVVAGVVYTYRVKASQGGLESDYSNEASTAITSLQFEVAAYSVLEDDATVTLRVTRSGDPSVPVTVKFATSDGTATVAGGDYASGSSTLVFAPAETSKTITLNVNDDDLLEGAETFNVTLSNTTGAGAVVGSPGVAVVTVTDNQVRLAPSNLSAAVLSGSQVRLTWTDNSGNESGFDIERKSLGGAFAKVGQAAGGATVFTDTGLTANTSYSYQVRAISVAGNSGYSNEASVTTLPPAPAAPSGLTAVLQDGGKVRLAWADNSLNESGFLIERKDGDGVFGVLAGLAENSTSYMDTGRVPGGTYAYRVRAVNAGGESGNSNTVTVVLNDAPGTPSSLTANAVSSVAIRLSWTVGGNSTATKIERRTDAAFVLVGTVAQGTSTFVDQSVQPNVTYTYQVRASSLTGDSEPSNTAQAMISTLGRIKVTPTKLTFGRVKAGTDRTKTFTIKNTGSGSLGGVISGISQTGGANGPFDIVEGGEPFTLARGQVRKVTVRFRSDNPGSFSGSLTITSSDPDHGSTNVSLSASTK